MFNLREYRLPTDWLPDCLPWALLDGVRFRKPALARSDDAELVSTAARIDNALRRLGSDRCVFVEALPFVPSRAPLLSSAHPSATVLDEERQRALDDASSHFCTSVAAFVAAIDPVSERRARHPRSARRRRARPSRRLAPRLDP